MQLPNTLGFKAQANDVIYINENTVLANLPDQLFMVGHGSNLVFVDEQIVIPIGICQHQQITVKTVKDCRLVTLGAGLDWHHAVTYLLNQGYHGLENLALIPGTVGAAPVQNIGAYGVELADYCLSVQGIDLQTKTRTSLTVKDCQFSYRDSIFKSQLRNLFIIESVTFKLPNKWQANNHYGPLANIPLDEISPQNIYERVIATRQAKLPDPAVLGNAGSFFKNPIVSKVTAENLIKQWPHMPQYPMNESRVKIAAGYLIEQAELKGMCYENVAVHDKQALVLVNLGTGKAEQLLGLTELIINKVEATFGLSLEPEVRFIGAQGEVNYPSLYLIK